MPAPFYSTVTVQNVTYEQENNFAGQGDIIGSLPPESKSLSQDFDFFDSSVFAVGIHAVDPDIGSGDATNLDSLIGLKILEPGSYTDVEVPIFPVVSFPELTDIRPGQTFPPNPEGDTVVRAAIWEALTPAGVEDPPDDVTDPEDLLDLVQPFAVSQPATISNLDQNPSIPPTDLPTPTVLRIDADNETGVPIERIEVRRGFPSGDLIAELTGDPLPFDSGTDAVFENVAVVDLGTDLTLVAFDGAGNELAESDETVFGGGETNPFFGGT
jgi:hypothetical protein